LYLAKVYDEADDLKRRYSDQLVAQAQEHFPNLYEYVLTGYKSSNSFLNVLGHQYKQSMPSLNLVALMNELNEQYKFHLAWAEAPERYQIIIDGIRAQQVLEVMDLYSTNRYATSFQNRILKGLQALDTMNKIESANALSPAIGQVIIPSAMISPANSTASSRRDLADPDEAIMA
jgi:hypothetical protein